MNDNNPFAPGATPRPQAPPAAIVNVDEETKPQRIITPAERLANAEHAVDHLLKWMIGLIERGKITTYSTEITELRTIIADFNQNRPT